MKINELNSNIVFVLVIVSSLYKREFIYLALAVSTLMASTCFHFTKEKVKQNTLVRVLHYLDIMVAASCYLYMFYFTHTYITQFQSLIYILLLMTIAMFFIGKTLSGIKIKLHSYFHIAIGVLSSVIVLLK